MPDKIMCTSVNQNYLLRRSRDSKFHLKVDTVVPTKVQYQNRIGICVPLWNVRVKQLVFFKYFITNMNLRLHSYSHRHAHVQNMFIFFSLYKHMLYKIGLHTETVSKDRKMYFHIR